MVRKNWTVFTRIQVYCHTGLCRFGERFSLVEYVVRRSVVKPLVRAFFVKVVHLVGNSHLCFRSKGYNICCAGSLPLMGNRMPFRIPERVFIHAGIDG